MDKRQKLIKDYSYLLWYVREDSKEKINDEALVEMILNNGDWKGVQSLLKALGIRKVANIFYSQVSRKRHNYSKRTKHFFNLYFKEHVP